MYTAGDRLAGRYLLVEALGSGGMGRVWRATDELLDIEVAIKEVFLPLDKGVDPAELTKFYNRTIAEARNTSKLRTMSGVVTIYDVLVENDGRPAIVMELVKGQTLQQYVQEHGPYKPAVFAHLALQLIEVLREVHRRGIVHRDIKPSNIIVRPDGRLVLCDFGIARYGDDTLTLGAEVIGTPAYMSPEHLRKGRATEAMDVWQLAMSFYYALTGTVPFHHERLEATIAAVLHDELPPLPGSHPLNKAVTGMLQKNAQDRLGLAQAAALLGVVEPTKPKAPWRFRRRPLIVAGVATLVVAAAAVVWFLPRLGENDSLRPPVTPSASAVAPSPSPASTPAPALSLYQGAHMMVRAPKGWLMEAGVGDDVVHLSKKSLAGKVTLTWVAGKNLDAALDNAVPVTEVAQEGKAVITYTAKGYERDDVSFWHEEVAVWPMAKQCQWSKFGHWFMTPCDNVHHWYAVFRVGREEFVLIDYASKSKKAGMDQAAFLRLAGQMADTVV